MSLANYERLLDRMAPVYLLALGLVSAAAMTMLTLA